MKLYTEEQVNTMLSRARLHNQDDTEMFTNEYLIAYETPIELPSDEEIEKECNKLPFEKHVDCGMYNDGQIDGFELGAKWMKEQILNQNKTRVFGESDDKQFWSDKPNQNK